MMKVMIKKFKKRKVSSSSDIVVVVETNNNNTSSIVNNTTNNNDSTTSKYIDNDSDNIILNDNNNDTNTVSYNPQLYGCRSVDEYQRLSFIDQGSYGLVFKAKCRETGEVYALKQVKPDASWKVVGFPITALRETNILLSLQHNNIVRVKEMVVGSTLDKIFMVMEHCGKDVKACMELLKQPFSTAEVKRLMLQLLDAIDHIHNKWYIHRDLKTSNLLYTNGKLTVCDFGMARKYGSPVAPYTHEVVTLWYRCPEVLLGSQTYSTPLDMWSVGCIFAEFLMSKPLFPGKGELDQISLIFKLLGAPNEERWPGCSSLPNFNKVSYRCPTRSKLRELFPMAAFSGGVYLNETGFDLLSRLLNMDPSQRISASEALKHQWFKEGPEPTSLSMMPMFKE